MTKIKICGLTRPEDIEVVNSVKPDYVGFVFADESKRMVTASQAEILKAKLSPAILSVGVFVNDPIEFIVGLVEEKIIDLIQLHGAEDEVYMRKLREAVFVPIIRAVQIQNPSEAPLKTHQNPLKNPSKHVDFLLLDSGKGSGKPLVWKKVPRPEQRFFLAGGLNPENVVEAIKVLNPYAVDVSSGVETDGLKDAKKISEFVRRVRNVK